jgi:hypothetical protein
VAIFCHVFLRQLLLPSRLRWPPPRPPTS